MSNTDFLCILGGGVRWSPGEMHLPRFSTLPSLPFKAVSRLILYFTYILYNLPKMGCCPGILKDVQVVHALHNSPERPHTIERDVVQESHDTEIVEVADDVVEVADFADEWRALCARQDEEYLESLQTDQERDQAQRREVDVYRKRKEALERRRLNLSDQAEPQDGISLQVKYPDGHVVRRRFLLMQPIQHLFDFVGSDDMATEVFSIQKARASPIRSTTMGRIIDHINESCTVFVTWDDVMDTDITDTLVPEEDDSPQNISSVPLDTTAGFLNLSHVNDTNESDLKTLLTTLASKVWIGETPSCNMINVCRENIMDGAI
ncbi:uncharacterized protein LOC125892029 [Epinephelus fuscoguttatus]|uniref:uncharacterized protein LOC125892029 n=1 Tax=Epinephelus fuscoguttatus TaxID=293821 RepID=UPI0020D05D15|nr:uncharacterized protein LOC125892029 [Epinephelus fuscoguttatus]XP_049437711.1 uncharacterized protein LOC125892029 [Epinephelus fuscoguttatus]